MSRVFKCPVCRKPLTKRQRRSMSPLEHQKLQTAYWMMAWHREMMANLKKKKTI